MDMTTSYMGLRLAHPFMVGASPLGAHLDTIKRLEDAGASALVLHSLFEEQITMAQSGRIRQRDPLEPEFAAALAPFPGLAEYPLDPDDYLDHLRRVKNAVRIPVIASLNGTSPEAWLRCACLLQDAGADALELNCYEVATDLHVSSESVEAQIENMVSDLKGCLRIPVAVKLSPFFTAFANVARRLDVRGADGLVIFNRFYQTDIDIRSVKPLLNLELSRSAELLLRLRWVAILYGRVTSSLALTGGVETPNDGIKALLAGAQVVQMVSAILRHGPGFLQTMRDGLARWMEWQRFDTVDEFRGKLSLQSSADPAAFERANYIRTLHEWSVHPEIVQPRH
jgi:dihydroorotate dehydrogenase (fumarate)